MCVRLLRLNKNHEWNRLFAELIYELNAWAAKCNNTIHAKTADLVVVFWLLFLISTDLDECRMLFVSWRLDIGHQKRASTHENTAVHLWPPKSFNLKMKSNWFCGMSNIHRQPVDIWWLCENIPGIHQTKCLRRRVNRVNAQYGHGSGRLSRISVKTINFVWAATGEVTFEFEYGAWMLCGEPHAIYKYVRTDR